MNNSLTLIQEMFAYNHWANQRLLTSLAELTDEEYYKETISSFKTIHSLLNHVYYYDAKYLQRIVYDVAEPVVQAEIQRMELADLLEKNSSQWMKWIREQKELKSEKMNDLMLLNVHNIHHRGQLTVGFNLLGKRMLSLDAYVFRDERVTSLVSV